VESAPRAYRLKASNAAPPISTFPGAIPAAVALVGLLADLLGSLRLVLATSAALAVGTAAAILLANTFWLLFFIALVQAAALAPTTSIADALSVNAAKPQIAGKPYGWIRGSGSAAFVLGTLIIGQLVSHDDLTPIIWMNVTLLVVAAGATALVPRVTTRPEPHASGSPVLAELHGLLRISRFRVFIIVSALVYGSHATHDAFAVIRWSDAGIDTSVTSILWSEAVAAEVLVFFLIGPALLDRFGARAAAVLAAAVGIARWSIEGVTTSVLLLSILQPLHGLTFALLHLTCMRMMATLVPARLAGTAQAFLRVWLSFGDCRTDFVVRGSLCQLWRSGILSDGSSLRGRTPICLVWLR
jgi:MFS transporter, PPP family, 3-phenylpropionic acid transporter